MTATELPPYSTRLSRRELLRGALLGGAGLFGASLLACGSDNGTPANTPSPTEFATPGGQATISAPNMTWVRLDPRGSGPDGTGLPAGRSEHTLVSDGTKVYLFGGRATDVLNDDLWIYDIAQNQWNNKVVQGDGTPPQPRFGHNAIWDSQRNKLLIFGGQDGTTFFNDVWEYDPATSSWNDPLALFDPASPDALPAPRFGAAACYDDSGHVLITHGQAANGLLEDTWQFDLASSIWTDVSPAAGDERPTKRCLVNGAWDTRKRRLLIYGGQSDDAPFLDDLWGWSPEFGWQQIAREPRPSPRNMYSNVYDGARTAAYLFGGRTADGPVSDTWIYYADGENWAQGAPTGQPPSARYGHDAAIAPDGAVYVYGGTDGTATFNDLWRLDIGS